MSEFPKSQVIKVSYTKQIYKIGKNPSPLIAHQRPDKIKKNQSGIGEYTMGVQLMLHPLEAELVLMKSVFHPGDFY